MKTLFILALAATFFLNLHSQTQWTKHPDNPVFLPGAAGEWDEKGVAVGSILFYDNSYHMWYSNCILRTEVVYIGYATSDDGINWTRHPENPVLAPGPEGSWDENDVLYPFVLVGNGQFHMWYLGHSGTLWNMGYRVGYASSNDGLNWIKHTNNPVLSVGPKGSWDGAWVGSGPVVFIDSLFHMWYMGWDGEFGDSLRTGHATSPDGVTWTKDPLNPVLTAGTWDAPRCFPGPVFYDGSNFHMWYVGGPNLQWKSGYARSSDGSHWIKYPGNPVLDLGPAGEWDSKYLAAMSVMYDPMEGKFRIWYTGNSKGGKESVGYAESYKLAWRWQGSHLGGPSCVVDNSIYVFNSEGSRSGTISPDVHAYSTVTNTWNKLTSMPVALTEGSIGRIGDKIYLVGGWRNQSPNQWVTDNSIMEYDMDQDSWSFLDASPVRMGSNISCVKDGLIYLFGGLQQNIAGPDYVPRTFHAWTYDPIRETWDTTSLPRMSFPHIMYGSAEVLDGSIYLLSGVGPYPDFEIQPSEKFAGDKWEPIADMPVPVVLHSSIVHENKILVFGGDSAWSTSRSFSTNFIQQYDPSIDSWSLMEPMPFQRSGMAGEKVGNYVYLIGGYTHDREPSTAVSEIWRFNLDSLKEWVVPCSEVLISRDSLRIQVDSTQTLTASVQPTYVADNTLLWSSDNESVASVTSEGIVTGKGLGEATITASANGGGCIATCTVSVESGSGITVNKADRIQIFPNPGQGMFTIETSIPDLYDIKITSLNGQLIYRERMEGSSHQVDLSSFSTGVFFITIRSNDFVTTRKIIKY